MKKALHGIYSSWKDLASKAKGSWKSLILVILGALGILALALALYVFILWVLLKGLILMGLDVEESWTGIFGVSLVTIACSILTSKDNASSKQ